MLSLDVAEAWLAGHSDVYICDVCDIQYGGRMWSAWLQLDGRLFTVDKVFRLPMEPNSYAGSHCYR